MSKELVLYITSYYISYIIRICIICYTLLYITCYKNWYYLPFPELPFPSRALKGGIYEVQTCSIAPGVEKSPFSFAFYRFCLPAESVQLHPWQARGSDDQLSYKLRFPTVLTVRTSQVAVSTDTQQQLINRCAFAQVCVADSTLVQNFIASFVPRVMQSQDSTVSSLADLLDTWSPRGHSYQQEVRLLQLEQRKLQWGSMVAELASREAAAQLRNNWNCAPGTNATTTFR